MLGITFQADEPYTTWELAIHRDPNGGRDPVSERERQVAKAIMAALAKAGWTVERSFEDSGWPVWAAYKDGADAFKGWTKEEAKKYMAEARKILRKFGLTKIPKRRLTLADRL